MALRDERDFHRGLLALGAAQDIEPLLDEALSIIAEAVATGTTVVTASALTDPYFHDRGSVQQKEIEAVVCAPIGSPPIGAVYPPIVAATSSVKVCAADPAAARPRRGRARTSG